MTTYKKREDGDGWIVTFPTHAESVKAINGIKSMWEVSTEDEISTFHRVGSRNMWIVSITATLSVPISTIKYSTKKPFYSEGYLVTFADDKEMYHRIDRPFTVEEFTIDILRKRITPLPVPFDNDKPVEFHYISRVRDKKGEPHDLLTILLDETSAELAKEFAESDGE